ncbi:hypothetical protein C8Q76DRAFT_799836 [Earliella scabrosa]|nr:hypothetical protein C8Q76DRAFT_799836 [Earliella scabrosa]
MATTTQILFNSPALHSLKRDQLVKLCKIHSIKANGKSSELIERLKQRALEFPPEAREASPDGDGDVAMEGVQEEAPERQRQQGDQDQQQEPMQAEADDDDDEGMPGGMPVDPPPVPASTDSNGVDEDYDMQDVVLTSRFAIPRPSEQWEVVMDDIEEVDESAMGTGSSKDSLRTASNGEFGTHSSKTSVSSSIKALATSLGIKRVASKLSHHSEDIEVDDEEHKMPSFSPGKLFGSIKARDSLAEHAKPYSEIPPSDSLPETDHFKFSTPDASILDMDEDANADGEGGDDPEVKSLSKSVPRLGANVGAGVKSTIRLVSHPAAPKASNDYAYMSPPKLPVFKTDFDLTVGTPGTIRTLNMWSASPRTAGAETGSLYPKLPLEDLKPVMDDEKADQMPGGMSISTTTPAKTPAKGKGSLTLASKATSTPGPVDEPDMFSPAKPSAAPSGAGATPGASSSHAPLPRSTPFLFGSPLPRREPAASVKAAHKDDATVGLSNAGFDNVAKSVLEEMHRRLAEANASKAQSGGGTSTSKPAFPQAQPLFGGLTLGATGPTQEQDRFAKAHDAQFSKMDSIATHYAARRPNKRKSDALGVAGGSRPVAGQKRRSSAAGARVISAGTRKKMAVPGGFGGDGEAEDESAGEGAEEDEDDAGARRSSKRIKITQGWDVHRGQRVSLAPPLPPEEEEKKQKELEATKRDLAAAKARRRSSRGRPSIGAQPTKAKTSRFGFLSSAKSLVRNVWNMGGGSKAKPASASNIPVPKAPTAPAGKKGEKPKAEAAPKSAAAGTRKASGSQPPASSVSSTSNKLVKPKPADPKSTGTLASTKSSSSRARSPIPSFAAPSGTVKSTTTVGTTRSRVSSNGTVTGTVASRQTTRTSTVSSMGTRSSMAGTSTAASSIGTRRSLATTNTLASSTSSKADGKSPPENSVRKRTSSLLAPTASSLAKAAAVKPSMSGRTSGLPSVAEAQKPKRASIIQPRASSSKATIARATSPMSPPPTRIFSQPLTNLLSPASSSGTSPAPHASLTAAATSIMGTAAVDAASSPSKIPRPAVLPPKPKQLVARKPRISRSRVIAKLGAQRAAVAQGSGLGSPGARSGVGGGRTRSSMGMGARRSLGGIKAGRASTGSEISSAALKKRVRQSEYIRRKSRVTSENEAAAAGA